MDMEEIYSQIILDHSRNQENKHEIEDADITEPGHNPSCGDEIVLQLKLDGDKIVDAAFTGEGCAISQAATSVMCDVIIGKTKEEAKKLADIYVRMIKREDVSDEEYDLLEDAVAFKNIQNMPQRVKCALLSWKTLDQTI
ncbi:Fe-S cluster assembly sulfur transfer protein SufU [Anaerococcus sp. AGMB09787]|uniref:Fe-S cluster assembly sulfur transfer protein SufU n=1 Tax=Anaerococcus sp. AGMB09787 TaxID=2922869 RepID=UPI001FAF59CE|nr:SUF system NifU family Fe-S cluster assembly protein [Anaerococcus sp. AGMB09787]